MFTSISIKLSVLFLYSILNMLKKQKKKLIKKQNINMLQGYFKFGIILTFFFSARGLLLRFSYFYMFISDTQSNNVFKDKV